MPRVAVTKIAGLHTSPNTLSSVPVGALKRATNCVINFPNTLEPRRGFEYVPYTFGLASDRAKTLLTYQGKVLVHYGDKLAYDSGIAFTDYTGSFTEPASSLLRMKSAESASNFYFTTDNGPRVLDAYNGTPVKAGVPRGPVPTQRNPGTLLTGNPGDGWFSPNGQVAYIGVIGKRDANNNVTLGEGSNPFFIINPADISCPGGLTLPRASKLAGTDKVLVETSANSGFKVGDVVTATYDPSDTPPMVTGTFAITEIPSATSFIYQDGLVNPGTYTALAASTITSGAKNVLVAFDVSPELDTTHFIQIYRTLASLSVDAEPSPDYYLVNEVTLTPSIIATKGYVFTDSTPESLLLSPYYNNANVGYEIPDGSPDNENGRPPLCYDLDVWDNRLWGANITERQNMVINLLGTGAPDGLQVGDTITIGGITYTAIAETDTITATTFKVYLTTTPVPGLYLPSEAVRFTAQSLALAVCKNSDSPVNCYYTSTEDETPGELFLEAREASATAFSVYVSRPSAWNPEMGSTSDTAEVSTADAATNGVWFSKKDQPEAVPRLNRLSIGPRNGNILRIKPLTERLYVFTDRGIYTVSSTFPYRVDLLSKTAILVSPDSLVDFDDSLFALTTQGIVRISDAGVGIISVPIETDIKRLFGEGLATLRTRAQAVGYESYRKYIITMPTETFDTDNTQALVYDVATQTWTKWDKPVSCAVVVPQTDYLYIAATGSNTISKERKTYSRWDYVDESFSVVVTAVDGTEVTLASAADVAAGDLIYQSALCHAVVDSVDGNVVTVKTTESWTVGLATLCYKAFTPDFIFTEQFAESPNQNKHFREVNYIFKTPGISEGVAVFTSELNPSEVTVDLDLSGWGAAGGWGDFAWLQPSGPKNKRVLVPSNASRCSYLGVGFRVTEALGTWALYGYVVEFDMMSERNSR